MKILLTLEDYWVLEEVVEPHVDFGFLGLTVGNSSGQPDGVSAGNDDLHFGSEFLAEFLVLLDHLGEESVRLPVVQNELAVDLFQLLGVDDGAVVVDLLPGGFQVEVGGPVGTVQGELGQHLTVFTGAWHIEVQPSRVGDLPFLLIITFLQICNEKSYIFHIIVNAVNRSDCHVILTHIEQV